MRLIGRRAGPLAGYDAPLPALSVPATLTGSEAAQAARDTLSKAANAALSLVGAGPGKQSSTLKGSSTAPVDDHTVPHVTSTPLTSQSFSVYGQVIAGPGSSDTAAKHLIVNQGTARKYAHQAEVKQTFPADAKARTNVHLYRCDSLSTDDGLPIRLMMLERHRFSSQSFVPLESPGHAGRYLVVVALNGADDTPDLSTLASFVATGQQAICYHPGTWHLPMTPIGPGGPLDYACIVAESDSQPELNCDEKWWEEPVALIGL